MFFWLLQFGIFLLYSILLKYIHKEKLIWWISLIQFMGLAMFRARTVGTDTYAYCQYYIYAVNDRIPFFLYEKLQGFFNFMYPFTKISNYDWTWMLVSGFIPNICIWLYIKANSKNEFLSIYMYLTCYFYFSALNAARQAIAMGMAMSALTFIYRRKYLYSIPFLILAIMIHPGAVIIMLITYPMSKINWNNQKYFIFSICCIIGSIGIETFQNIFIHWFPTYAGYSFSSWESNGRMIYFYIFILLFVLYAILILSEITASKITIKNFMNVEEDINKLEIQNEWITVSLITLQLVLCILLNRFVFILRATTVLLMLCIQFIPEMVSYKTKIRNLVTPIVMLVTFVYMVLRLAGNYGDVWPYSTFFCDIG